MRALSFQVMRRNNPGLGIAGILEGQQKGLGSPAYLRSMLGAVDSMGGDTDEHGLGVSKETSYALMELQRSSKESDKDFLRTLTGILESGKDNIFKEDRAYLNEFVVRNFSQVQRELLKTQSAVSSGTTFDILRRFDSLGGEFSARDRAMEET